MAQLVKMLDYVSRYEQDLPRYTAQYIRLKRSQWERMKKQWDHGADLASWHIETEEERTKETEEVIKPTEDKRFFTLSRFLPFRKEEVLVHQPEKEPVKELEFQPKIIQNPRSIQQLRKLFIDQLFHFQLKWASSTLAEWSRIDGKYMRDKLLKELLGTMPDSFLVFYYPVLKIKKAPVELEIIILTPVECFCITVLKGREESAFAGSSERFWIEKTGEDEAKILNPTISLNRMSKIVGSLFSAGEIDFPIRKVIVAKTSYIDFPGIAHDIQIIDRRDYPKWLEKLKKSSVPMKSKQFQAAQAILQVCQTTASSRLFTPDLENEEQQ